MNNPRNYSTTFVPYDSVYDIPNSEYRKHQQRSIKIHKDAEKAVSTGKADSYDDECERLTDIQTKKITSLEKLYGRYLVADDSGYYAIGKAFLKKYRNATQTRVEKISNILKDL
jgi:hypothetical protein